MQGGEPKDLIDGITDALDELEREADGDVLVFLSGEAEIRDAQDALSSRPATEIVPLYGRLSSAEQHRVFDTKRQPGIRRRVVLATNVAETSLTVPGIKYVVDAGTARISRYSPRAKVQRLPIEAISQASANQRAGRAGRTSDGIAIRLYAEDDFTRRSEFTDPEILRTDLAAVILQMMSLGLGDIMAFPFLQPPDRRGVRDGLDLLAELGAVEGDRLTKTGRMLTQLPVDVRFARMLLESKNNGVVREVAAIVAGLSIQDPARASGREASAGRPAARPVRRPDERLHLAAQPLESPREGTEGTVGQRVPPDVQGRVPELPAGAGVARPVPATHQGREAPRHRARREVDGCRRASTGHCSPGCCPGSGCAIGRSATTSARAGSASWCFPGRRSRRRPPSS